MKALSPKYHSDHSILGPKTQLFRSLDPEGLPSCIAVAAASSMVKASSHSWYVPSLSTCREGCEVCRISRQSRRPATERDIMVSQDDGYYFGGPYNMNYISWGSILGFPYLGKLPFGTRF